MQVKTHEGLTDEVFSVKVSSMVGEVNAAYLVDDQQMEICVKMPGGYPLRGVDVRPVRRVGVAEKVWRRWLFAVQQVITAHVSSNPYISFMGALWSLTEWADCGWTGVV